MSKKDSSGSLPKHGGIPAAEDITACDIRCTMLAVHILEGTVAELQNAFETHRNRTVDGAAHIGRRLDRAERNIAVALDVRDAAERELESAIPTCPITAATAKYINSEFDRFIRKLRRQYSSLRAIDKSDIKYHVLRILNNSESDV